MLTTTQDIVGILSSRAEWKDVFGYNEFSGRPELRTKPALDDSGAFGAGWHELPYPRPVQDLDLQLIRLWLERECGLRITTDGAEAAMTQLAQAAPYHPVKEYLHGCVWDGVRRIGSMGRGDTPSSPSWLHTYFRADDTPYVRDVGRMWLVGMLARIFAPGCSAPYVLLLGGAQGCGKTTGMRALAFPWHTETIDSFRWGESRLVLREHWLVELADLEHMVLRSGAAAKSFLAASTDSYRPPYAKAPIETKRHCVFYAATNKRLPITVADRRIWQVDVGRVDVEGIKRDRDLLLAEAYEAYQAGETWFPQGSP